MVRALPFDFRGDTHTYDIDDQFMFGPALLINPVTQPMYYEPESTELTGISKSRTVYLPDGAAWYDFWTGKHYTGGQTIIADAPLDTMPIYVRSGSILPIGPDITYADQNLNAALDLYIYPGRNGHFTLYDDEGDNYNYEAGHFATIRIAWDDANQQLTLHKREGSYAGMPTSREFRIVVGKGFTPLSAESASVKTVLYEGEEITIQL
jgi:alpha-D-xyloside xylohydrolase